MFKYVTVSSRSSRSVVRRWTVRWTGDAASPCNHRTCVSVLKYIYFDKEMFRLNFFRFEPALFFLENFNQCKDIGVSSIYGMVEFWVPPFEVVVGAYAQLLCAPTCWMNSLPYKERWGQDLALSSTMPARNERGSLRYKRCLKLIGQPQSLLIRSLCRLCDWNCIPYLVAASDTNRRKREYVSWVFAGNSAMVMGNIVP